MLLLRALIKPKFHQYCFVLSILLSSIRKHELLHVSMDTAQPGWDEPTAMQQTAGSMGTLARHNSVIPRVAFLLSQALTKRDIEVR
jgi:hypothetical protein